MKKINFTKEHKEKLDALVLKCVYNNTAIIGTMNQGYNVLDLFHNLTINSILNIKANYDKQITKLKGLDEWSVDEVTQAKLESLEEMSTLLNLTVGYRRFYEYEKSIEKKKLELSAQIEAIKEAKKTPDEKLRELEAQLSDLNK